MKKTLLVILALVMALTLVIGSVSAVSAASPPQVIGSGVINSVPATWAVHAIGKSADGEATGQITFTSPGGALVGRVNYLEVNSISSAAWIIFDSQGEEYIEEVQKSPAELSYYFTLDNLNDKLNLYNDTNNITYYDNLPQAASDNVDLISLSYELVFPLNKLIIR